MSIFISYRRDGGTETAFKLFETLNSEYDTFIDQRCLKNGRFDERLEKEIRNCDDFVLVVTPNLFDRCSDNDDCLSTEIETALKEKKNIIPVLVNTDRFPDNVPIQYDKITKYNALFWSKPLFFEKLRSFLCSCKKLSLQVTCTNDRIHLTDESVQKLIEHFKHRIRFGIRKVSVSLSVADLESVIQSYLRNCWPYEVEYMGMEAACRSLRGNAIDWIERVRNNMQTGIGFMLMDEMLDADALLLRQRYIERYGIANCVYRDHIQVDRPLWTYLVWTDILNEMLQEFIRDVVTERANQFNMWMMTDVFAETGSGKELWNFPAFLCREDPDDQQLIDKLRIPCENGNVFYTQGDYLDMCPATRVRRIYPRFYYELGRLFNGETNFPLEEISKIKNIENLYYYQIGVS